jgi:glucose/arabinose dehydrogenase
MAAALCVALLAVGCGGSGPSASRTTTGPSASPSASASPGGSPSAPTPSPSTNATPHVEAIRIATVELPLGMAARAGDPALYAIGKTGVVWALRDGQVDPTPVLDLSGSVSRGDEQGLLGMTFSPDGRFGYVDYTDRRGDTNVVEYAWGDAGPDLSTTRRVLFVDQPFPNHNGGDLAFGPDGDLYVGLGDGGSDYTRGDPQGDPDRNGQNLGVLLGKMLRIQPRRSDGSVPPGGAGYEVPADNRFVGTPDARPEIWAYGLRNPWRYSFDRQTGDLWIGDVGAGAREEIDRQPAGSAGGENYGWNAMEGTVEWRPLDTPTVPPVYEYDHRSGACAVTGGYVYRGSAIPSLEGWYVFGDFCRGILQALRETPTGRVVYVISGDPIESLSSFGEDASGELYAISLAGGVFALRP